MIRQIDERASQIVVVRHDARRFLLGITTPASMTAAVEARKRV
jgi:hypothetical protein